MDYYTFDAGKIINRKLFFSSNCVNALYCMDLESGTITYIDSFPNEGMEVMHLHKACYCFGDELVFTPDVGNSISIVNVKTLDIRSIELPRYVNGMMYADGCPIDSVLYLFPAKIGQPLIECDIMAGTIKQLFFFNEWCHKNLVIKEEVLFARNVRIGDEILMAQYGGNSIIKFNYRTGKIDQVKLQIENLLAIFACKNSFFLTCKSGDKLYEADNKLEIVKRYKCPNAKDKNKRPINNMIFINNSIYVLPAYEGQIMKLNVMDGTLSLLGDYPQGFRFYSDKETLFFRYEVIGKNAYLYPRNSSEILMLTSDSIIQIIKRETFDFERYIKYNKRHYGKILYERITSQDIIAESNDWNLENYLDAIYTKPIGKERTGRKGGYIC